MSTLEDILSGGGEKSPTLETTEANTQATATEGGEQPQPEAEQQDTVTETPDGRKMVPLEALQESRGKAKRYTEQVAAFETTVKGLREDNANLSRQVTELLARIPQQERQQEKAPDFFENPVGATQHLVAPHFEQIGQTLMAFAKDNAIARFSEEKVSAAEQAFIDAMQRRTLDPADYHKVVGSPNRYAAAVQWHQQQLARAEIGDDPAAFRAKVEAEILAKHGLTPDQSGTQTPAPKAPVLPSNLATARNTGARSGPAWGGPTAIGDIFRR